MVTTGGGTAVRLTRGDRRALDGLAGQLDDCAGSVGHRLRRTRWWERPAFARAMTSMTCFGAVSVLQSCNAVGYAAADVPLPAATT
jgi:hypothetical protein